MSTNYRYSEAFKQQVIRDIESGRYKSAGEASEAYGIGGHGTVANWLERSGRGALLRKVVRVEKPGERREIKRLQERIRKLESALADATMDKALEKSFFEILCEEQEIEPAAFKKKSEGMRSSND